MIRSGRPIRGTLPAPTDAVAGIEVAWHPAIADDAAPIWAAPLWSGDATGLCFAPSGVARYRCTSRSVAVAPRAGADPELVEALLIATALPALLWLEGAFVLHAAAVVPAGAAGALAIAGASGSGKSHFAAALLARGGALVADDSVALRWAGLGEGGRPVASGLAGGYHLGAPDEEARPFHPVPADRGRRMAPLAAVIVLGGNGPTRRVEPAEAAGLLLAHRHRPSVPRHLGVEPRILADAVRLARAVPVYRWGGGDADAPGGDAALGAMVRDGERR